ncbi:UDP-N-acetylglucosamine-1-phosphate transferase [Methanoplanus sp. FWC-SCC4]|uniref:UDP-N-acetylglucosamine-1-phosphate transferase n=1 Tax=Methanochimaera problematica TaxID=2609417 RepID=A0AA97FDR0_9EURY|nr:UDP-N-acetylglucosamine-1-phosphate transferase [Methanoplanus sp. FWC-SCC4]WOF16354.1 UDP-N-acetylglucosamine-1-phosphate transferase [Methanoplanus sp. FWC-SCC4]
MIDELATLVNSLGFMVLTFFLVPFFMMLASMPNIIHKLRDKGCVSKDMYKKDLPDVALNGGLVILLLSLLSISIISLFYSRYIEDVNYAIITVVSLFAFFGILDDVIDIGRPAKLILLYYCAYSLMPFIPHNINCCIPFIGTFTVGIIALQIIIPLYVPVVANLVNMHSGFNGLAPGLSLMIIITLIIKALYHGDVCKILFIVSMAGALAGYYLFERYPSRIFWGNVGALSVGAAIGAAIVVEGYLISGFIILIPHTVNFLLYVYWRLSSKKYPLVKFGKIRDDGTLEVPNPLTLKWILPYYFRLTEKQATSFMYVLTAIFCIIGFAVPG